MTGFLLNIKLETGGRKMTLNDYSKRYETILNLPLSVIEKDKMLSSLMSDLERAYRIPMIKNEGWEKENVEVHALYFQISMSRSF
jgi:hypothetical protein